MRKIKKRHKQKKFVFKIKHASPSPNSSINVNLLCARVLCIDLSVSSHQEEMHQVLDVCNCHATHDVVAAVVGIAFPVFLHQVDQVHDGRPHTATQKVGHQWGHAAKEVVQLLQSFPLANDSREWKTKRFWLNQISHWVNACFYFPLFQYALWNDLWGTIDGTIKIITLTEVGFLN